MRQVQDLSYGIKVRIKRAGFARALYPYLFRTTKFLLIDQGGCLFVRAGPWPMADQGMLSLESG
jgi:hypothetical protein